MTAEDHAFVTAALDPETYGGSLLGTIYHYAVEQAGVDVADADAWKAEQEQLAARGKFYFACTQVCFAARRR